MVTTSIVFYTLRIGVGEMAYQLRALPALPRGPEFNSQQLQGGSQPS